jgi:TolB-like protein
MVAGGVAVLLLAVAYFVVAKFWVSKHIAGEKPAIVSSVPAAPDPAVAPGIPEKSVAVLPFIDLSERKDQEYFSDGLSEDLIDLLSKIPDLHVPARTSSFYFKGKSEEMPTIAHRLAVAHLLEGSVRKSGNRLRITAQLVRADSGIHLWSQTFDGKLDDVFRIQDEIASTVVKSLKATSLQGEVSRTAPTASTEAYAAYLQGRASFLHGSNNAEMEKAAEHLHRALTLDPAFAPAWAELSFVRFRQVSEFPFEAASKEARYAAERALALDPALAEAHVASGRILETLDWNWAGADAELNQALTLSPMNARVVRAAADIPLVRGELGRALRLYQRAKALDPLDDITHSQLAWLYFYVGRLAEAEAAYREALDLNTATAGSTGGPHWELAMVLLARGEPEAALDEMRRESSATRAVLGFAIIYYAMERMAESDAAMVAAEREYARHLAPRYSNSGAVWIACAHAYRGEVDRALGWLDHAYAQRDFGLLYLKRSPLLRNLESDPRYKAFLRKMNLPE